MANKDPQKTIDYLQEQLAEFHYEAIMGKMINPVAHDINNPLMVILGLTELISMEEGISDDVKSHINTILKQSQKCRRLIENLLLFSRHYPAEKLLCDVGHQLDEVLYLLQYEVRLEGIEVIKNYQEKVRDVKVDLTHLKRILLNVVRFYLWALKKDDEKKKLIIDIKSEDKNVVVLFKADVCSMDTALNNNVFTDLNSADNMPLDIRLGLYITGRLLKDQDAVIDLDFSNAQSLNVKISFAG